jgi:hypothetical protein
MKKISAFIGSLLFSVAALGATFQYFNPAAGILKGNPNTYVTTAAVSSDILATFTGTCNNTTFMRGDGSCQTPPGAGGGTVNSVALSAPSVFGVSGSPITNTGTLALSFATGQTANSFLATPDGTTGALSLRTIALGDLPTITAAKGGTGVATLTGIAKGNGTSAFTVAASSDVIATWSGTCSSSTFLRGDGSCQTPATGTGTVTSVALTVPSGFSVTGSPVTTSGTLAISGTLNPAAGGTGVATLTGIAKGNGTSAFTVAASGDVTGLWGGTCSSATYLRGDGSCQTPPTGGTSANPTATIGLTAVNGSAGTYLRSDGAPALSQAIVPTWTGLHTFAPASGDSLIVGTTSLATRARFKGSDQYPIAASMGAGGYVHLGAVSSGANPGLQVSDVAGVSMMAVTPGGTVINTPSSGTALAVNGSGSAIALQVNAAGQSRAVEVDSTNANGVFQGFSNSASEFGTIGSAKSIVTSGNLTDLALSTGGATAIVLATNSTARETISGTGNVTINAPSSGPNLTLAGNGASITQSIVMNGSTTGANYLSSNNSGGGYLLGIEASTGANLFSGAPGYSAAFGTSGATTTVIGSNSIARILVNSGGAVAINTPTAGVPLTVTASAPTTGTAISAAGYVSSPAWQHNGTNVTAANVFNGVYGNGSNSLGIATGGTEHIVMSSTGATTVNAPSSGTALTVTSAAAADGLQITQGGTNGLVITCGACSSTDNTRVKMSDGSDAWSLGADDSLNYAWFRNENSGNDLITFDTSDRVAFPTVGTTATAANAVIDSGTGNRLLRSTSSRRYKTDIIPLGASLNDEVMKLKAVRYHSKAEADSKTDWFYGLIAEDVAVVEPRLVVYDKQGRPDGVQYDRVGVLLLGVVQEQQEQIKALREELNDLKKKVH